MDRLSSRDGGQGDMMPPPFANLNPVMANYVNSNDVPVGDMLQRQLFGIIAPSLPHQRHIGGPASEHGATPDSAYGTNSVRGKPSTGKRSLYNGSNASTMSTVARLEGGVNGIQLDTRSEASLPRSEYLMPLTGAPAAEKWVSSMMPAYGQKMTTDDPWESAYSALDTTDVFSTPDINNDSQSVNGGAELVELHCIKNQNGFNCSICPKQQGKVTKTRSEMLKHIRTHIKPFKCNEAECKMAQIGFANETDLKRHHTSCHKDIRTLSEFFRCHHGLCKDKEKPWTRWDNMKKHILDVHGLKETDREKYRVRNTGPLESDLAGIGLPPETYYTQSTATDTDMGSIDLFDDVSELDQLMASGLFPHATLPGKFPASLLQMRKSFSGASRIMPSKIRSSRPALPNEPFDLSSVRIFSVPSSTKPSAQISSSAPLLGQQRRNIFLSAHQNTLQFGNQSSQRRLPHMTNQTNRHQEDRDALLGPDIFSRLQRPSVPTESAISKKDIHRAHIDASQNLGMRLEPPDFFRLGDEPWNSVGYLAVNGSASKGASPSVHNDSKEDHDQDIQLEDNPSKVHPVGTETDSDGDHDEDGADNADAISTQENDDGQPRRQLKTPQKELQELKDPQESQQAQESQDSLDLQGSQGRKESQPTLQGTQAPPKDKQTHTEICIDLTGPDTKNDDHGSVDEHVAAEVNETHTASAAVVLDDVAFDKLSDDRLQTVLRRLTALSGADGRLERLGFRLSEVEVPVAPAKRSVRSVRSDQTATKETEPYPYACTQDGCSASFATKSSLRKHEKRHERPFACTFNCTTKGSDAKVFGSKNDWKRHEEGLHFQEPVVGEEWQCGEIVNTQNKGVSTPCHGVFKSAATYQQHLTSQHGLKESDKKTIREKMARYRALPIEKCSYWCGFCKKHIRVTHRTRPLVPKTDAGDDDMDGDAAKSSAADTDDLHETDGAANGQATTTKHNLTRDGCVLFSEFLSERFNHIDNHFVGRGERKMNIVHWVHDDTLRPNHINADYAMLDRAANRDDETAQRKRHHGDDQPLGAKRSRSSKRKATPFFTWICCTCNGFNTAHSNESCSECQHIVCDSCKRE